MGAREAYKPASKSMLYVPERAKVPRQAHLAPTKSFQERRGLENDQLAQRYQPVQADEACRS